MRLRRPRCRCPAGADAEAAAEAAAAAAVVWARTQHFSRCPARRGRGAGSVNSSPSSQSLSVQIRTPLLSLPLSCPCPPLPRSWITAAQLSPTSAGLCARWPLLSPRRSRQTFAVQWGHGAGEEVRSEQDARDRNGQSEGLHLSFSRRGPEPRLLPKTRLSGRRC